jgi:hypothetical protein
MYQELAEGSTYHYDLDPRLIGVPRLVADGIYYGYVVPILFESNYLSVSGQELLFKLPNSHDSLVYLHNGLIHAAHGFTSSIPLLNHPWVDQDSIAQQILSGFNGVVFNGSYINNPQTFIFDFLGNAAYLKRIEASLTNEEPLCFTDDKNPVYSRWEFNTEANFSISYKQGADADSLYDPAPKIWTQKFGLLRRPRRTTKIPIL